MATTTKAPQSTLFPDELSQDEKLAKLYPWLRREKKTPIEARDVAKAGLNEGVWPWLEKEEANIQLRTARAADWLRTIDPVTGIARTYKTPERGRLPDPEVTQTEMEFDIASDARQGVSDRKNLRHKVYRYWFRFRCRPPGLAQWQWSNADDEHMEKVLAGIPSAADFTTNGQSAPPPPPL